ncbi:hypothetical protein Lfu02_78790 [Longispora fulva]|nr:hypothetical protein Lfu02_78790 [Longispora fulva]
MPESRQCVTVSIADQLADLQEVSRNGIVSSFDGPGPDLELWKQWMAPWVGRPWAESPFLAAESYFYRQFLRAVEYFDSNSAWRWVDPFAPVKSAELTGTNLAQHCDAYGQLAHHDVAARTQALLHASL